MTSGSTFLFICLSSRTLTHCWAKECIQDVQEKVKRDFMVFMVKYHHILWHEGPQPLFFFFFLFKRIWFCVLADVLQFREQLALLQESLEKINSEHSILLGCITE